MYLMDSSTYGPHHAHFNLILTIYYATTSTCSKQFYDNNNESYKKSIMRIVLTYIFSLYVMCAPAMAIEYFVLLCLYPKYVAGIE